MTAKRYWDYYNRLSAYCHCQDSSIRST